MAGEGWNPQPGELVPVYGAHDGTRYAVVLSTSRHRRQVDPFEARADLAAQYGAEGDELVDVTRARWFRHTVRVVDDGCLGPDCGPGAWCEDGDGAVWCSVLYGRPRTAGVRDLPRGADKGGK
jgi:hypothetical protein